MENIDPTEHLLRESIQQAKAKLQGEYRSSFNSDRYLSVDQNLLGPHNSNTAYRQSLTYVKPNPSGNHQASLLQQKVKQLHIQNQALRSAGESASSRLRDSQRETQDLKQALNKQSEQFKSWKTQSNRQVQSLQEIIEDLKKQIDLNKKIADKYKAELQTNRQALVEKQTQIRQLSHDYNSVSVQSKKKQQDLYQQIQSFESKLKFLAKQNAQLRQMLFKKQAVTPLDSQVTERSASKVDELMEENLRLLKKLKEVSLENTTIKHQNTELTYKVASLKEAAMVMSSQLQHSELKSKAILEEAAKNGVSISHKRLVLNSQSKPPRKSIHSSRDKLTVKSASKTNSLANSTISKKLLV